MPDCFFLGVDGGQSSTVALIANEQGRVLGRGVGGPCNHVSAAEGRRKFLSAVGDCLQQACLQAGLSPESVTFAGACFGLSGGFEDKAAYINELIRSEHLKLTHDGEIALTGATGGAPGVIVIAGTGSFAFGKNAQGETARSGGWGYIYGDEGGAFDLTRQALRAALRYEEGWGPETILRAMLLEETETASANELLHLFYADYPRTKIASYATLVTRAAEAGDAVALEILKGAARDLCSYINGAHGQLFRTDEPAKVSYIGGVFQSELLRSTFCDEIREKVSKDIAPPIYDPATGALLEAFTLAGLSPKKELLLPGAMAS